MNLSRKNLLENSFKNKKKENEVTKKLRNYIRDGEEKLLFLTDSNSFSIKVTSMHF